LFLSLMVGLVVCQCASTSERDMASDSAQRTVEESSIYA